MTRAEWRKAKAFMWIRKHWSAVLEIILAAILAIALGLLSTCNVQKIADSLNGYCVIYEKADQVFESEFPDKAHAEYFAEALR